MLIHITYLFIYYLFNVLHHAYYQLYYEGQLKRQRKTVHTVGQGSVL